MSSSFPANLKYYLDSDKTEAQLSSGCCCCRYQLFVVLDSTRVVKSNGNMRWESNVARMGLMRNVYNILVAKSEGKRPLGRPRRRWKYNVLMDLKEIGWEVVD